MMKVYLNHNHNRLAQRLFFVSLELELPPVKKHKFKKRAGTKQVRRMERLESVGYELNRQESTMFRTLAARCSDLAQDRCDIACSTK